VLNAATRVLLLTLLLPGAARAQGFLDEFSYEGLRLAGVGFEFGGIASDRLTSELTGAFRVDYGMFAPHVRVVFGLGYFKGQFDADEIQAFEDQIALVVYDPNGGFEVRVGDVTWADWMGSLDLQYLPVPAGRIRPYAGLGVAVHLRDGDGPAISGTFVEDALDTIEAGIEASAGVEVSLTESLAVTADLRAGLSGELRTIAARGGFMVRFPQGGGS
jgi:opacity protein-like surface antigen